MIRRARRDFDRHVPERPSVEMKVAPQIVSDRAWRDGADVWLVGRLGWFLAGPTADDGWDHVFIAADDSPEFQTQTEADAEAARRNQQRDQK